MAKHDELPVIVSLPTDCEVLRRRLARALTRLLVEEALRDLRAEEGGEDAEDAH